MTPAKRKPAQARPAPRPKRRVRVEAIQSVESADLGLGFRESGGWEGEVEEGVVWEGDDLEDAYCFGRGGGKVAGENRKEAMVMRRDAGLDQCEIIEFESKCFLSLVC